LGHLIRKIVPEMTCNVLNPSTPHHRCVSRRKLPGLPIRIFTLH